MRPPFGQTTPSPDAAPRCRVSGLRRAARTVALVAASTLVLAGCMTTKHEPAVTGSIPQDGYRTRHPIVLTERAETLDVAVGGQTVRMTATSQATLRAFAAQAMARGASGLTILVPSGSSNEAAAYQISRQVAAALKSGGVPAHGISFQSYKVDAGDADAPIRVAYPRVVATLTHACGQWPDQMIGQTDNTDYWNFGCATQANIAAMVANPEDLVTPQGLDPLDATRHTMIIDKYRQGLSTKSAMTLDNSNLSDVGAQ